MIEIAGLPAHILLIHVVVVLAPIAGLAAIAYAAAPRWRGYLAWPLGVLSPAGAFFVYQSVVTGHSGAVSVRTR